jgi:hypothetical protein
MSLHILVDGGTEHMNSKTRVLSLLIPFWTIAFTEIALAGGLPDDAKYFPLDQPAELSYSLSISGAVSEQTTLTLRASEKLVVEGKEYVKVVSSASAGLLAGREDITYMRVAPEGVFALDSPLGSAKEYLQYPFPLEIGTTWRIDSAVSGQGDCRVAGHESITLQDGKRVDCLRIDAAVTQQGMHVTSSMYLAPKAGMVRRTSSVAGLVLEETLLTRRILTAWKAAEESLYEEAVRTTWEMFGKIWTKCGDTFVATKNWDRRPHCVVQFKGTSFSMSSRHEPLTEADKLNGIEWKGPILFQFAARREFGLTPKHKSFDRSTGTGRWSDWEPQPRSNFNWESNWEIDIVKKNGVWEVRPDIFKDMILLDSAVFTTVACNAVPGHGGFPAPDPLRLPTSPPAEPSIGPIRDAVDRLVDGGKIGKFAHGTECTAFYDDHGLIDIELRGKQTDKLFAKTKHVVHAGIDISAPEGTPVRPIANGKVVDLIDTEDDRDFGSLGFMVLVEHDVRIDEKSTYSIYLHLRQKPSVALNSEVVAYETELGRVGSTGAAFGSHLHLEVRHFPGRFSPQWKNIYGKESPPEEATFDAADFEAQWTDPLTMLPERAADVSTREPDATKPTPPRLLENSDWPPFFKAAALNDVDTLTKFLHDGADPNQRLEIANSTPGAKYKKRKSGDDPGPSPTPSPVNDGWTALHVAAACGSVESIELLIISGADIKASSNGQSALVIACMAAEPGAVETLLKHKASATEIDKIGRSPLHWACQQPHTEIVKLLLESGADPNVRDRYGRTPYMAAKTYGNGPAAQLLLQHGADPFAEQSE